MSEKHSQKRAKWLRCQKEALERGFQDWLVFLRKWSQPKEQGTPVTRKTAMVKTDGPMIWLAEQIVKRMGKAGYPARIHSIWRGPEQQQKEYNEGQSKAKPWQSPHQFLEGVDIIHETLGWEVSDKFWDKLAVISRQVAKEYGVTFALGYDWGWDKAHVELKDWRVVRDRQDKTKEGRHRPTTDELALRFREVLPQIAKELGI